MATEAAMKTREGYCQCGCGSLAPIAKMTSARRGHVKGQSVRYVAGHSSRAIAASRRVEEFFARVDQTESCWVWTGGTNTYGYGRMKIEGRTVQAHRWSYEYHVGPIPEGLVIDHLCRNRACVNPEHLEPVTNAENIRRGSLAQRTHCANGHEFTPENTGIAASPSVRYPHRECRACKSARNKAWREGVTTAEVLADLARTREADAARALAEALGRKS